MVDKVRIIRGGYAAGRLAQELLSSDLAIDAWLGTHTSLVKGEEDSQVNKLDLDDDYCFLKLYRYKSKLHKAVYATGLGRPMRAFNSAKVLLREGVSVPRMLGCLQVPEGLLLLSEGIACKGNMREVWSSKPSKNELLKLMLIAGQTIGHLHQCGYAHGDCKWSNLLWDGSTICMVDLDGVTKTSERSSRQGRDIARFTINAEELEIGSELYDLFLENYMLVMGETRQQVVERTAVHLYSFRAKHLARYGPRGQRLI